MSGRALNKDAQCRSLGFVNNPPRGYFRTVKTCYSAKDRCRTLARGEVFFEDSPATINVVGFGIASIEHETLGRVLITLNAAPLSAGKRRFVLATVHNFAGQGLPPPDCAHIVYAFQDEVSPTDTGPQTTIRFTTTLFIESPLDCQLTDRRFAFSVIECDDVAQLTAPQVSNA